MLQKLAAGRLRKGAVPSCRWDLYQTKATDSDEEVTQAFLDVRDMVKAYNRGFAAQHL